MFIALDTRNEEILLWQASADPGVLRRPNADADANLIPRRAV
jgi:hypothetical protein